MSPEFLESLKEYKCSECGHVGGITVMRQGIFGCRQCESYPIDPYACGPWDEDDVVLESMNDLIIASYKIPVEKTTFEDEPFEDYISRDGIRERLEFVKYLREHQMKE